MWLYECSAMYMKCVVGIICAFGAIMLLHLLWLIYFHAQIFLCVNSFAFCKAQNKNILFVVFNSFTTENTMFMSRLRYLHTHKYLYLPLMQICYCVFSLCVLAIHSTSCTLLTRCCTSFTKWAYPSKAKCLKGGWLTVLQ